jgi:hypothetical protein
MVINSAEVEKAVAQYRKMQDMDAANRGFGQDEFLPSSNPNSPHKTTAAKKKWKATPTDVNKRPDEWLGGSSPTKPRRSWKVKVITEPNEDEEEEEEVVQVEVKPVAKSTPQPTPQPTPNLEEENDAVDYEEASVEASVEYEEESVVSVEEAKNIASNERSPKSPNKMPIREQDAVVEAPKNKPPHRVPAVNNLFEASVPSMFQSAVKPNALPKKKKMNPSKPSAVPPTIESKSVPSTTATVPTTVTVPSTRVGENTVQRVLREAVEDALSVSSAHDDDDDVDETDYETRMKGLLSGWRADHGVSDEECTMESEVKEAEEKPKNTVDVANLSDNSLDHIILATSDFKDGLNMFEEMTGLKSTLIGSLRGVGTKSARAGLTNGTFIEIIGPDPSAPEGLLGDELRALDDEGTALVPYHYAIRRKTEPKIPNYLSWDKDEVTMVQGSPNGDLNKWNMTLLYGHSLGGVVPAYVNWGDYHPTASLASEGSLNSVTVRAPAGHYIHDLVAEVEGLTLEEGKPMLSVSIDTPTKGEVTFWVSDPEGLQFPGYGDDNHPSLTITQDPKKLRPKLLPIGNSGD